MMFAASFILIVINAALAIVEVFHDRYDKAAFFMAIAIFGVVTRLKPAEN